MTAYGDNCIENLKIENVLSLKWNKMLMCCLFDSRREIATFKFIVEIIYILQQQLSLETSRLNFVYKCRSRNLKALIRHLTQKNLHKNTLRKSCHEPFQIRFWSCVYLHHIYSIIYFSSCRFFSVKISNFVCPTYFLRNNLCGNGKKVKFYIL